MSGGSCRAAFAIAGCTSCAAASMSRSRSNCSVMVVTPSAFVEVIESRPAMVENCFSSGVATAAAMVSGLAPGRFGADLDGGEVHVGQIAHRQLRVREHAEDEDGRHDQRGRDRTADEESRRCSRTASAAGAAASPRRRGCRATRRRAGRPRPPSRPAATPLLDDRARGRRRAAATTARCSTVWSGLTTNT